MDVQHRSPNELERLMLAQAAMPVGALASFVLAAVTVPFQGLAARAAVLIVLVGAVAWVGGLAGYGGGLMTACMASFAFDFFHVAPLRTLHLPTLAGVSLVLGGVALLASAAGSRRRWTEDGDG